MLTHAHTPAHICIMLYVIFMWIILLNNLNSSYITWFNVKVKTKQVKSFLIISSVKINNKTMFFSFVKTVLGSRLIVLHIVFIIWSGTFTTYKFTLNERENNNILIDFHVKTIFKTLINLICVCKIVEYFQINNV